MRYPPEHRDQSRIRIRDAAGRAFRSYGFEGVGVDGLSKEAGVTSGAFYRHFPSKNAAFREVAVTGLRTLEESVTEFQMQFGDAWLPHFIDFYVDELRNCDLSQSCGLQSLTSDVMRMDEETRGAYEDGINKVVDRMVGGFPHLPAARARARALALLSLLSGSITLARSLKSVELSGELAEAVKTLARIEQPLDQT